MALLTLAIFSAVAGVLILWVFKVCSNQRALKATRRRLRAHLLAMRLFGDDPVQILRSQGQLLAWNARYLALLLPPFLVVAIPLFFAWDHLDAVWGHAPFAPGETTLVTARICGNPPDAQLNAPSWLAVESPAVNIAAEKEVSWRVRVREASSGQVSVLAGAQRADKQIDARPGLSYLPDRTRQSGGPIEWLEVRYPRANPALFGMPAHWAVWFFIISTLAALLLRGKMRVTF